MDNTVKNIPLENIIPIEFDESPEKSIELGGLINSIKKYGIIEPIIVRQEKDKYEILAGKKRYQAAKIIGLKEIPVLIRNISNNYYEGKKENKFINPFSNSKEKLPKKQKIDMSNMISNSEDKNNNIYSTIELESKSNNNHSSDIINLSELNKKENERDEIKMNNEIINNGGMNPQNTMTNQTQAPTFGGRFFPSLEDEPTNMNMGGINIVTDTQTTPINPLAEAEPNQNVVQSNNLIDLTEESKEMNPIPNPVETTTINNSTAPQLNSFDNNINNPLPSISTPEYNEPVQIEQQNTANDINLEMPNYPNQVQSPTPQQQLNNGVMEQSPISQPYEPTIDNHVTQEPQFDMSQSVVAPTTDFTQNYPQENVNNIQQETMLNTNTAVPPMQNINMEAPLNQMPTNQEMPNIESTEPSYNTPVENNEFTTPENVPTIDNQIQQPITNNQEIPSNTPNKKNITPVINTIRNLATTLQEFGYGITLNEEELENQTKITININKY